MATEHDIFERQLGTKKKRSTGKTIGKSILGLFLLAALGVGGWLSLSENGRKLRDTVKHGYQVMRTVKENPNLIFDRAGSDHVNILLIGRDVNWKPGKVYDPKTKRYRPFHVIDKDTPARSDSMIVVTLDKDHHVVRMVSLPRDAQVHLPPNKYGVREGKLNAAHAYGGPELLMRTLNDELGLKVQHYAVIKFDGFKKLIDEVGGIQVNVEGALKRDHRTGKLYRGDLNYDDNWGNLHQHLKPGMQTLNGQQAHDYVRFREDLEGDPGRIRRQQAVMRALAKRMTQINPLELPGIIDEIHRQFETDLSDNEIASAAYFAKGIGDSQKIQPLTLFGAYSTRGSFLLNRTKNIALLNVVFGSSFDENKFLARSPSTNEDEIGETNNSSPQAKAVLREAGLLKDAKAKPDAEITAPVVDESSKNGSTRLSKTSGSSRRHRTTEPGHTRKSIVDEEPTPDRRTHRRSESLSVESSESASTESSSSESADSGHSDSSQSNSVESPVPSPEQ